LRHNHYDFAVVVAKKNTALTFVRNIFEEFYCKRGCKNSDIAGFGIGKMIKTLKNVYKRW